MSLTELPRLPSASLFDLMAVTLPDIDQEGVVVTRFDISEDEAKFDAIRSGYRAVRPGTYTKLTMDGRLWMTDTPAEKGDHYDAVREMHRRGGRVLINGLGLGMVVSAALALPNVEHVDVVEHDERVARIVGAHYASDRCTIHHADAYEQTRRWPAGTRWTVAWHDIWANMSEDNLPEMAKLNRSYGRRTDWQGCWGREHIEMERRRTANAWWR
jgi:hypothetical protein